MKIIFLDIDWVLIRLPTKKNIELVKNFWRFNINLISDKSLFLLKELIKKTWVRIIISSSWRNSNKLLELFYNKCKEVWFDIKEFVIWKTISEWYFNRWKEIKHFIDNFNENIENFLILDDEDFDIIDLFWKENFIITNWENWFDYWDFKKALNILTRK